MFPLLRAVDSRIPRGFWSGILLGFFAFALSLVILNFFYWFLRSLLWPLFYSEAYVAYPPGPYPAMSGEWVFSQFILLFCAGAFGAAAAHWSGRKFVYVASAAFILLWVLPYLATAPNPEVSVPLWRQVLSYLKIPAGFAIGAFSILRYHSASSAFAKREFED